MLSGNEVSQIMLSLFLTYYGGHGRRPLWIAWGVALSAASCFILTLPHFVFGAGPEARALTEEYLQHRHFNFTVSQSGESSPPYFRGYVASTCWLTPASRRPLRLRAGQAVLLDPSPRPGLPAGQRDGPRVHLAARRPRLPLAVRAGCRHHALLLPGPDLPGRQHQEDQHAHAAG